MASSPSLHVLIVHNGYRERGGEDAVVETESSMLTGAGHRVTHYRRHNDEIDARTGRLGLALQAVWSSHTVTDLARRLDAERPDVVHVHNTFPLISPAVYTPARERRIAVVQTLHNYRLVCPQAMLMRGGEVCERCVGRVPWRAVVHRCYRGSALQSGVAAATVQVHRWRGTWARDVDRYIVLDESARHRFVAGGVPDDRIRIKPNAVEVADVATPGPREGCLFVGRLSPEKGLALLLDPRTVPAALPLTVIGEGVMLPDVQRHPTIRSLGWRSKAEVLEAMSRSRVLVVPSVWPEMFGLVVIEAFACGLPVIASRTGALASLVEHGRTGLLFEPGDAEGLARCLHQAATDAAGMARMGQQARLTYEALYSPSANLRRLESIYGEAIEAARG